MHISSISQLNLTNFVFHVYKLCCFLYLRDIVMFADKKTKPHFKTLYPLFSAGYCSLKPNYT